MKLSRLLSFGACLWLALASTSYAGEEEIDLSNIIGLEVKVDDSCDGQGNTQRQNPTASERLQGGEEAACGEIRIAVTVEGKVERQDAGYDFVYVNDVPFSAVMVKMESATWPKKP